MSSDVLARVDAFYEKADELAVKGHLLRAAENFGRAAEAARALGEDNLVAVHLQLRQSNLVGTFSIVAPDDTTEPHVRAAHRAQCVTLLSGAVAALERRRQAGTLLEGKCAAAEEAWRVLDILRLNPGCTAAEASSWAALVGYEELLRAGKSASEVLARAHEFAAACSAAQLHAFAQHAAHAAEAMQQPRRHGDVPMDIESNFTNALRIAVAEAAACGVVVAGAVQLLAAALQRLQRSGVLQARHVAQSSGSMQKEQRALQAAMQKSLRAPGLRTCALPGCGAREAHPAHFKSCAACRTVVYCCREHQVAGWPAHKKACKAARKAAEEEEDGAGPSGA